MYYRHFLFYGIDENNLNFFRKYKKWKKILDVISFSFVYAFNITIVINMYNYFEFCLHFVAFFDILQLFFVLIKNQYPPLEILFDF